MPRRIMVYLKESDLNIIGQRISGQDLVELALLWAKYKQDLSNNAKLDKILEILTEQKAIEKPFISWVFTPNVQKEVDSIIASTTYAWFGTIDWDEGTYDFEKLCPWIKWDLREKVREGVKEKLKVADDIDFSLFKI